LIKRREITSIAHHQIRRDKVLFVDYLSSSPDTRLDNIDVIATMSRSRAPVLLATAAAGGVGYYLYSAGGSPKVAEKKFESASRPFLSLIFIHLILT